MALAVAFPAQTWSGTRPYTPKTDFWPLVALCAMFGVPALATAWFLMHCRILADARGLTFRGFFRSRLTLWNEIEDFEMRVPTAQQSKAGTPHPHFKSGGKWRPLLSSFTSFTEQQPLLDRIAREAKQAKARAWQLAETREDGDWPKAFEYRDVSGWRLVGAYLLFTFTLTGLQFLKAATYGLAPLLATISMTWSALSPWGRVGFVVTPLALMGAIPLTILAQYPAILARRRYLGQKIIATREEISLFRDGRKISLKWDEIESYHLETLPGNFQPDKGIIETRRQRIEFVSGISNTKSLLVLVQNRARNATTSKWLHQNGADADVLGGAASFYRGGSVGVGPKIHHYRTRTARAFLFFGAVMMGAFPFVIYQNLTTGRLGNGQIAGPADIATGVFLWAVVAIIFLPGVLGCLFASVECGESGLRQRGMWGERLVRWEEIEEFRGDAPWFTVKSRKCTIRYGAFIADASGLRDEIERRSGIKCKVNSNTV